MDPISSAYLPTSCIAEPWFRRRLCRPPHNSWGQPPASSTFACIMPHVHVMMFRAFSPQRCSCSACSCKCSRQKCQQQDEYYKYRLLSRQLCNSTTSPLEIFAIQGVCCCCRCHSSVPARTIPSIPALWASEEPYSPVSSIIPQAAFRLLS
jgi:hypothetical protein